MRNKIIAQEPSLVRCFLKIHFMRFQNGKRHLKSNPLVVTKFSQLEEQYHWANILKICAAFLEGISPVIFQPLGVIGPGELPVFWFKVGGGACSQSMLVTGSAPLSLSLPRTVVWGAGKFLRHGGTCKDAAVWGKGTWIWRWTWLSSHCLCSPWLSCDRTDSELRYGPSSVYKERAWKEEESGLRVPVFTVPLLWAPPLQKTAVCCRSVCLVPSTDILNHMSALRAEAACTLLGL